jgi:hypothetical protein
MMGKNHKGAILVITDRATLHTKLHKLENRNSNTVSKTMIKSLLKVNIRSIPSPLTTTKVLLIT